MGKKIFQDAPGSTPGTKSISSLAFCTGQIQDKGMTQDTNAATPAKTKPENGFLNIIFNILIPVLILNKGSKIIGPLYGLIVALAFPLGYGAYDLFKRRKFNALSVLGLLNVGVTGSLALYGLHGIWFSVKEAAFPALIGIFVLGSAFTRKPFIETLLMNPTVMDTDLIQQKLTATSNTENFHNHMRKATVGLTLSFFLSAVLNFILAERVFLPIDGTLEAGQQSVLLNEQIAQMTTWSLAVVMIPSVIFLLGIFWYLLKGIQKFTGLTTDEIILQK